VSPRTRERPGVGAPGGSHNSFAGGDKLKPKTTNYRAQRSVEATGRVKDIGAALEPLRHLAIDSWSWHHDVLTDVALVLDSLVLELFVRLRWECRPQTSWDRDQQRAAANADPETAAAFDRLVGS
jgi:hypothetical protein